jgi:hypothetical protein
MRITIPAGPRPCKEQAPVLVIAAFSVLATDARAPFTGWRKQQERPRIIAAVDTHPLPPQTQGALPIGHRPLGWADAAQALPLTGEDYELALADLRRQGTQRPYDPANKEGDSDRVERPPVCRDSQANATKQQQTIQREACDTRRPHGYLSTCLTSSP